jgi:hypothetical protein
MEPANKALWHALRRVARPEKPLDLLKAVWPVVLGPRLASHTRPVAWHKGSVTIEAPEPEWREQVEHMTGEIRKQINRWWGTEMVHEVRIASGKRGHPATASAARSDAKSASSDASATPHASTGGGSDAESKLQAALKELEPSLRGIADEDLRDLIARVASKYLAVRDKK